MRSDIENPISEDKNIVAKPGKYLSDAVNWFKERNIPLYGIQRNPTQDQWTTSPKAYGDLMIDDSALGCPLVYGDGRPYVDWKIIRVLLQQKGVIE